VARRGDGPLVGRGVCVGGGLRRTIMLFYMMCCGNKTYPNFEMTPSQSIVSQCHSLLQGNM